MKMVVLLINYQLQYSSNVTLHSLEIFCRVVKTGIEQSQQTYL